jgi:hypothetical protein
MTEGGFAGRSESRDKTKDWIGMVSAVGRHPDLDLDDVGPL